jgi:hypothetical protein
MQTAATTDNPALNCQVDERDTMCTNENRQKLESENKIEQAFCELVQEHDIDHISVTMICK